MQVTKQAGPGPRRKCERHATQLRAGTRGQQEEFEREALCFASAQIECGRRVALRGYAESFLEVVRARMSRQGIQDQTRIEVRERPQDLIERSQGERA